MTKSGTSAAFVRVAQNLYRYAPTGTHYAFVKKAGRRIHRSLKPKDRKLADRRLADFKSRTSDLAVRAGAGFGSLFLCVPISAFRGYTSERSGIAGRHRADGDRGRRRFEAMRITSQTLQRTAARVGVWFLEGCGIRPSWVGGR